MAFASKAEQRLARSINVTGADKIVTNTSVERKQMGQDKNNLNGGSIGGKGSRVPLNGGSMKGVDSKSSTLYGSLGKDGGSTYKKTFLRQDVSRNSKSTTREKLGGDEGAATGWTVKSRRGASGDE